MAAGLPDDDIFSSKAAIYAAPNRHTRFIPETELLEPFLTEFTGATGTFLQGAGIFFGRTGRPKEG